MKFEVDLIESGVGVRASLGVYEADFREAAMELARRRHSRMMGRFETGRFYLDAHETSAAEIAHQQRKRLRDTTAQLPFDETSQ